MDVLTVQDAAALLAVDAKTIYRLIERGQLPAFKVGRQWRMRQSDLESWIDGQLHVREATGRYSVAQMRLTDEEGDEAARDDGKPAFSDSAFSENADLPIHRWVPWIAGFSATFVEEALGKYLPEGEVASPRTVLDPFAGVGTTLVAALLRGHPVYGFEINPYAALAADLKLKVLSIPADALAQSIDAFASGVTEAVRAGAAPLAVPPRGFSTRRAFLSPEVERKVLLVKDFMDRLEHPLVRRCFEVALASELVGFSNYSYEPSLGTREAAGKRDVADAPVVAVISRRLRQMLADIRDVQQRFNGERAIPLAHFRHGNFFELHSTVPEGAVDLVVTSPPYLNNYHYIRNSRPQLYWLGLVHSSGQLKRVEQGSFGKFWQTVRGEAPIRLAFDQPELQESIEFLRSINTDRGPYGGGGWANYAATYFNDCHRFAGILRRVLRKGGRAVVVLGNSILQGVEFKTDVLFGRICEMRGLGIEGIVPLREKRTGTSIIRSSVRTNGATEKTVLYETAVVVSRAT